MKVLFVSDPHGADIILRKSASAIKKYMVDVFILAGDLTGKDIRPIIKIDNNCYRVNYRDKNETISKDKLREVEDLLSLGGHYYFHCDEADFESLAVDTSKIGKILNQKAIEKIEHWALTLSREKFEKKVTVFITPGNDDSFEIDKVIRSFENRGIFNNFDSAFDFISNEMITVDFSNPTPWATARELSEPKLEKFITDKIKKLRCPEKAIFNFHCPPFNTKIDLAPELDRDLKPIITPGIDNQIHVGSTAVRKTIEKYQPILSLHGHIHESPGFDKIGKTLCLNPGSEYENGILHGYIIEFTNQGIISHYHRIEG
jgi:Icc-related predicted phosphoesterase